MFALLKFFSNRGIVFCINVNSFGVGEGFYLVKILKYLKPYANHIVISIIMVVITNLSDLYLPNIMANIVNNGISKGNIPYIWRMGGYMLLTVAVVKASAIVLSYSSAKASMGLGKVLRRELFVKVQSLSQNEIDEIGTASLITRTTNDINQVQTALVMGLRMMLGAPITCIGAIILAARMNPKLSVVFFIIFPLVAAIVAVLVMKALPLFRKVQTRIDNMNQTIREKLSGIRIIRAFNRSEYEDGRFGKANDDLFDVMLKVSRMIASLIPLLIVVLDIAIIAIIWFASVQANALDPAQNAAELSKGVGNLMAFMNYNIYILFALLAAAAMFIIIPRASVSAKRINEVLEKIPSIKDREGSERVKSAEGNVGNIEFRDVTFSYLGAPEPVISDVSFSAAAGETTAVIGSTGSGKSTLVNLIPRFYDINDGEILVDGIDIRDYTQHELRSKLGFVPQKAFLFSGTVAENIRLGKEDATDEEIWHALQVAQAANFVKRMKNGINSFVSQDGTNLSGGQKQRLSIARALVKKPEIFIFDDSFSALDFKTDLKLRSALKEETKNSSIIIVAQRVGTIINADRIIVLEDGKIAGIGRHNELIESCTVYREIVESQLSKEEEFA